MEQQDPVLSKTRSGHALPSPCTAGPCLPRKACPSQSMNDVQLTSSLPQAAKQEFLPRPASRTRQFLTCPISKIHKPRHAVKPSAGKGAPAFHVKPHVTATSATQLCTAVRTLQLDSQNQALVLPSHKPSEDLQQRATVQHGQQSNEGPASLPKHHDIAKQHSEASPRVLPTASGQQDMNDSLAEIPALVDPVLASNADQDTTKILIHAQSNESSVQQPNGMQPMQSVVPLAQRSIHTTFVGPTSHLLPSCSNTEGKPSTTLHPAKLTAGPAEWLATSMQQTAQRAAFSDHMASMDTVRCPQLLLSSTSI